MCCYVYHDRKNEMVNDCAWSYRPGGISGFKPSLRHYFSFTIFPSV